MSKRIFDIIVALLCGVLLALPFLLIFIAISVTSQGSAIYWSRRVGQAGKTFMMPKFRTMCVYTPEVATDKLDNPDFYLTPIGAFLRHTSLDELPQLYSVLVGHMSLVGPRPALHNQEELIFLRRELGIEPLKPGITGWAQINGRDKISLLQKVSLDQDYLRNRSLFLDVKIIFLTVLAVLVSRNIEH